MRILILSEGNAETRNSWSGISLSVLQHLRALGHTVVTSDVDLYGFQRTIALARAFSPERKRWWVKYHLGSHPFSQRSINARRSVNSCAADVDIILQFGATFAPPEDASVPYVLYCDGNIEIAWKGREIGNNDASVLNRQEADGVHEREARVYHGAAAVLSISERLRQSFIEDFSIPPTKVTTVYAGPNFDISKIPDRQPRPEEAVPTILFVGRQFERKGGGLLLAAFERVRQEIHSARLVIVGPTTPISKPGVDFRGFIDKDTPEGEKELLRVYREADVYCMPSRYEGFAISFLEAMSFGLPCISTLPPWSPPEMILDGETGYTVAPEDSAALADRLVRLLRSRSKAFEMGRSGRERLLEHFNWPAVALRMEAVMKRALT